jgi:(aminoalkyl)phosphonate N-acetyltransferase
MSFKIRKALTGDFESIYHYICQLERTEFDKKIFRHIFIENLSRDNIHYYVAENEKPGKKKVIGFMSIYIQLQLHHCGKVAEIMELFVDEKFRSIGAGAALVNTAIKTANKNNCDVIELSTNRKRIRAHHFYEKKNFKKTHFKFTMKLSPI